ncbi:glutathione-disulfide reductase [Sphingomonas sp. BN140010]|uniref:Glutathione-disulfide reductase n=1 Tax=Sphingomonas arvum TaxID=2992113 RepID=A0ABT3JIQ8_9SPHN|nr:glutathione-disulfide reductase [Sphingomonas sp. BN140010]MCW3798640.1 glutathione-disulfide reductase [Sphingomonas sp. BN140010]
MSDYDFDLFIVGAGSGGVRAARIAGGYGARVAVAEEHRVGGTCVIRGCVPKKLLVYGAHFAEDLDDAAMFGWDVPEKRFDWTVLRDNVMAEVSRLEGLYGETLGNHDVTVFKERAVVTGPNQLRLASGRTVTAGKILIAVGARAALPEIPGIEHAITSNEVFHLERMPRRVVIAGGGYIANEFAGIFHQFGAHVTLVNRSDTILRGYDEQIVDRLVKISVAKGIDMRFNSGFSALEERDDGTILCRMKGCDDIEADVVLFAIGRLPNTDELGLENVGVELTERGAIKVDADYRSTVPSIFAVGDVTDRIQLTPVAIREGQAFADTQFGGKPARVDYGCVPSSVFSHPPIAAVGLTEGQAKNKLGVVRTYTSDFRPMKNVLAGRNERSLYKLVVDDGSDEVVGVHLIGPDAPEIMQAAAVAVKARLKKSDFDATVALHPTMAEELVLMR